MVGSGRARRGGTSEEGRVPGGPGIGLLSNEEVIQLARISLSAAFIKCRSHHALRDAEESSEPAGIAGLSEQGAWQGVKQIKRWRGGGMRKIKKGEKAKRGSRQGNQAQKGSDEAEAGGPHSSRASIVFPEA